MALKKLRMTRGDTRTWTLNFTSSGAAVNITGWTIFFTLKTHVDLPDSLASLQKIITEHTNAAGGVSQLDLVPSDTSGLDAGEYHFDLQVVTDGGEVHTLLKGKLILDFQVTAGTAGT